MARRDALQESLSALRRLRAAAPDASTAAALEEALAGKFNVAIALAAEIAAETRLKPLQAALTNAFGRLMINPVACDKGCSGKTAIAQALLEMDCDAGDVFLAGVRHRQMEPVWGGEKDTAVELRGICGMGLARSGHASAIIELTRLLADSSADARAAAAAALGRSGRLEAEPLLRFKVLIGDEEVGVTREAMLGLLLLLGDDATPFIAEFLGSPDARLSEAAALALGESRLTTAMQPLIEWRRSQRTPALRRAALIAVGLLRRTEAIDWLLSTLIEASADEAIDVIDALAPYRGEESVAERLAISVAQHGGRRVIDEFERQWRAST